MERFQHYGGIVAEEHIVNPDKPWVNVPGIDIMHKELEAVEDHKNACHREHNAAYNIRSLIPAQERGRSYQECLNEKKGRIQGDEDFHMGDPVMKKEGYRGEAYEEKEGERICRFSLASDPH